MRNPGLFEPDVLIQEVWGDARRRSAALSSEKRLMLAVLHNAFDCYQKYMFADDRAGRELFEEAAAWIECTSPDGLFSFENISETLDIEPGYFRRGWPRGDKRRVAMRVGPQPVAPIVEADNNRHEPTDTGARRSTLIRFRPRGLGLSTVRFRHCLEVRESWRVQTGNAAGTVQATLSGVEHM